MKLPTIFPDKFYGQAVSVGAVVLTLLAIRLQLQPWVTGALILIFAGLIYGLLRLLVARGDYNARWFECRPGWGVSKLASGWHCCACSRAAHSYDVPVIPLELDRCPTCQHTCCCPGLLLSLRQAWRVRPGHTHNRLGQPITPADLRSSAELALQEGQRGQADHLRELADELEGTGELPEQARFDRYIILRGPQ